MKVLISGGGIAGLTLAFWLHRHGHEPFIVERSPRLREDGYMIDFFGPGYGASEKMGLLSYIEGIHYQIPSLSFIDSRGKEKFSLQYAALRKNLFGGRHFNFMRGDLENLLYARIEDRAQMSFGTTVESFQQDGSQVHARLTDGTSGSFDLLVGADGAHSHIRELAFGGQQSFSRSLGYLAAAFIVDEPALWGDLRDAFYTLTVPERQVAVYPVHGGRLATFFIHKSHRLGGGFGAESAKQELREVYGGMGWIVPELLERVPSGSELYFDEVTQIEMPSWSLGRVALVGDACQCVSPLAGQGASLAVAGAYVLAEELAVARKGDIAGALARYESRLRPSVERTQRAGRRFAKWFVPDTRARLGVRNAIMRVGTSSLASLVLRRRFSLVDELEC
jgi:2-polyprenyl-6-methoxyphenol hydroxylase-like FAD-dependent oxidoreductase